MEVYIHAMYLYTIHCVILIYTVLKKTNVVPTVSMSNECRVNECFGCTFKECVLYFRTVDYVGLAVLAGLCFLFFFLTLG